MTEITRLENGIRVVTDTMSDVETVSLGLWVSVGSRFEEQNISGISHLLEHMAFKGTTSRSALQIAQQIEDVGGLINAYTAKDVTAYHAKVLAKDVPLAMDILTDIFQHSTMDAGELSKEKGVVLQEISQTYDTPDDAISEYFYECAYANQPYGRPILGSAKTVRAISSDDLLSYMHNEYIAPRVVVSAAGKVEHQQIVDLTKHLLTKLKTKGGRQMTPATYTGGEIKKKRAIEQVNLLLGFQGFSYTDKQFYTQKVLATVFGGGMSSRLFQEIREKRGLVYSIYAFASSAADNGLFTIFAGTGEKQVAELLPVVADELLKATTDITADELERAKNQLKAMVLMRRESTASRCETNARNVGILDRALSKEETITAIDAVDIKALSNTARQIFSSAPTLATLGPTAHVMPYDELVARLQR